MSQILQAIVDQVTNSPSVGEIGHEIFKNWEQVHQMVNPGIEVPNLKSYGINTLIRIIKSLQKITPRCQDSCNANLTNHLC